MSTPEQIAAGMTAEQLDLARHALGASSREPGHRNYFCASPGSPADIEWEAMVGNGTAILRSRPREGLPYNTYAVADEIKARILSEQSQ